MKKQRTVKYACLIAKKSYCTYMQYGLDMHYHFLDIWIDYEG